MLYVYVNVKNVTTCRTVTRDGTHRREGAPMFELSQDHEDFRAVVREFATDAVTDRSNSVSS